MKVGDRIKVVQTVNDYGDYDVGNEAIVTGIGAAGVDVEWCEPRFANPKKEADRLTFLLYPEIGISTNAMRLQAIAQELVTEGLNEMAARVEEIADDLD